MSTHLRIEFYVEENKPAVLMAHVMRFRLWAEVSKQEHSSANCNDVP